MGGAAKAIKSTAKGFSKVLGKVVKGVKKLGKGITKGVGKIMGKMGPIGTLAMGFVAPYAIGAIAAGGLGWASTAAQGIMNVMNTVKSVVATPFQALGNVVGKGVTSFGQSVGGTFQTITDKVGSLLTSTGTTVEGGAKSMFGSLTDTAKSSLGMDAGSPLSSLSGAKQQFAMSPLEQGLSKAEGSFSLGFEGAGKAGSTSFFDSKALSGVQTAGKSGLGLGGTGKFAATNIDVADAITPDFKGAGTRAELLSRVDDPTKGFMEAGQAQIGAGLSLPKFSMPSIPMPQATAATPIDASGYDVMTAQTGKGQGQGGLGESFIGQKESGLIDTEEFARRQAGFMGLA